MNVAASFRRLAPPPGESFHVATALVGLAGAVAAGGWLLARAHDAASRAAALAFGATLALLFLATALHHARPRSEALTRLDHAAVFPALAGAAAPVCVRVLPPESAALVLGGMLLLGLAGAGVKLAGARLGAHTNIAAHLALLVPFAPASWSLVLKLGAVGCALLAGGVGFLVAGAVLDARERPAFGLSAHGAFHVAALLGFACAFGLAIL